MKTNLLKLWIAALTLMGIVACGSSEPMTPQEATRWVAAYTPERIGMGGRICVETTAALRAHIDTLRSLDKVFRFWPSVSGEARYAEGGKYIEYIPNFGSLKQGKTYECRVDMARLTGIDTLRDFAFSFAVSRREAKFADINLFVDPDNVEQVVVEGRIIFNSPPSEAALDSTLLTCDDKGAISDLQFTGDEMCYTFKLSGIKRAALDRKLHIKYNPQEWFSVAKAEVVVPGLSEFKLLSAKRNDASEPFVDLEFSAPLSTEQELDGLITIDNISDLRIVRSGTNVKVFYPHNGLKVMLLRLSDLIRANDGRRLPREVEVQCKQTVIAPAIEVPISGTILPDGSNLKFPFRAVNLAAVDVEVVKIYTDNVMTFLQENEVEESYRLRRVGRLIFKQTVRLDQDKSLNLHQWQNFSIDLKNLFKQERGAIYNIRLSFRKAYSLYDRAAAADFESISGLTKADRAKWDCDCAYISRQAPDYDWESYNWRKSDDPAADSYYMVSDRMPEYNLMASNLGIVVKRADTEQLWSAVTDIMTTKPLAGIRVTAYNYQMREIGSAYTNEQGFADFKTDGEPFVVTATNGVSTTYLKINGAHLLSLSRFDVGGKKIPQGVKGFIYGERGVWRPGDDIYLTLIVEDKQRALPKNHPVTMELYTPEEQLYESITLTENANGIYSFRTKTSDNAPTGRWCAKFKVGGQTLHHTVRIETIKPNRLKIKVTAPQVLCSDAEATIGIESHWLTGPVASGLKASMEMSLFGNPRPFEEYCNYQFSNPLYTFSHAKHSLFTATLDSLGRYSCDYVPPKTERAPGMLQANLIARVTEAGGDESLTSHSVRYSPYESYVGICLGESVYQTDCDIKFPIVTLDADGKRVDRELYYKIYRLDWSWWWEGSAADLSRYVQSTTAEIVKQGSLSTADGKAEVPFRVDYPSWGKYLVYVEDTVSGHATGGVVGVDWPDWRGHSGKSDPTAATMLSFSLDKRSYEVGEYAVVYLPKSAGGRALLSVENGSRVISRRWVETSAVKETAHRILVTRDMAPNFYIYATLLQPHAQTINDLPIRMYGVEAATVIDKQTILHPEIDVPAEIRPQQEFSVKVREQDGKPMSYTLAIVDEGLLDITAFKTPQPWAAMNRREALGVKTWDMYNDVIGAYGGKFTSILSIGGDEALRMAAGKEKRFNPVVKFLGPFTLNGGVKTHKITLPMYVGSVRVMVVAAKDGAYGSADKTVAVRSPLMLLTTLPRKLNCGDRVRMPINLFAMEDGVADVQVSVAADGPLSVVGGNTKRVTFSNPSEKLVDFDLRCDAVQQGRAKVVVTAVGGGQTATETIWIDVANPLPNIVKSESVELTAGEVRTLEWSKFSAGEAALTLATAPAIDFSGAFEFVESYSHYCTEQLSAQAMYMLYARQFLSADEQSRAERALPSLLKMISSRQLTSGGFAYWSGNREAHDWATSMVGEVMTEARRQGFVVSNQCYDRWREYQLSAARKYRHTTVEAADLQQAYRLYTLVLSGEQPTAQMNKLRESKSLSRQALIRLSATYSLMGRVDVAAKLMERVDAATAIDGSYATFWSPLRDEAMELESYVVMGERGKAAKLAHSVAAKFSATRCTTQELAFVSAAISRFASLNSGRANEIIVAEAENGERSIRDLHGVKSIELNTASGAVTVSNKGGESLYISLMTSRRPSADEKVAATSSGVSLAVSYTDMEGKPIAIENLAQGTEFMAVIEVKRGATSSPSMALTFAVPSGWEIWNERLVGGQSNRNATYTDVRDDSISWYFSADKYWLNRFTVRLRAAYVGEYMLPPTICEDMYDTECRAVTTNTKIKVE
ncbi:MAG: alpha-2-macroglobulin [Alistipes sp.]|nr:alpha-2-macroglobulin [Alistipes sp.]